MFINSKYFKTFLFVMFNFGCSISYEVQYPKPSPTLSPNVVMNDFEIKLKDVNSYNSLDFFLDKLNEEKPYIEIKRNSYLDLSAKILMKDGSKINNVEWLSFDSTIATVESDGRIHALKEGNVTLKIFSKDNLNFFKLINLNVKEKILVKPIVNVSLDVKENEYLLSLNLSPYFIESQDNLYYDVSIEPRTFDSFYTDYYNAKSPELYNESKSYKSDSEEKKLYQKQNKNNEILIKKDINFISKKYNISVKLCNDYGANCSLPTIIEKEINPQPASYLSPPENAQISLFHPSYAENFPLLYSLSIDWSPVQRAEFYNIFKNNKLFLNTKKCCDWHKEGNKSDLDIKSKYTISACNSKVCSSQIPILVSKVE